MEYSAFIGKNVDIAAQLLSKGEAVAIPTETVYGLAANALSSAAVAKVFSIKQRPTFDPLIVHTSSIDRFEEYVVEVPTLFKELAQEYTPGPITFLMKKKDIIPDIVTSGSPLVALRIPDHPVCIELLEKLDFPLAAPSANPFGYISPTTAQHVADQLGDKVFYILDGGPCSVGVESTIITINDSGKLEILRKGGLSLEDIEKVTGKVSVRDHSSSNPEAPGMLTSHYAPRVPLKLMQDFDASSNWNREKTGFLMYKRFRSDVPIKHQVVLTPTGDYIEAARNLFAGMRYLDNCDLDIIYAELVTETDLGIAINDRLKRAAAKQ